MRRPIAAAFAILLSAALVPLTTSSVAAEVWDDNAGLAVVGGGSRQPLAPNDVWAGLMGRTISTLGSGGFATHSCVIDDAGEAVCMADNSAGAPGIGSHYRIRGPMVVSTQKALDGVRLVDIATGFGHTCAAGDNGKLYCWGLNVDGEVGVQRPARAFYTPKEVDLRNVPTGRSFVAVSAGLSSSCAVDDAGRAYCWGDNRWGRLGTRAARNNVPKPVVTSGVLQGKHLVDIASGWAHTCALDDAGAAYCWGAGARGRLGDGTGEKSREPVKVLGSGRELEFSTITAGVRHTCGTTADGAAYCWGSGIYGVLGTGDNRKRFAPQRVKGLDAQNVTQIAAGYFHTCAITRGGDAYCWGKNFRYGLGIGGRTRWNTQVPVPVDTSRFANQPNWTQLTTTQHGACTLRDNGTVYCWGQVTGAQPQGYPRARTPTRVWSEPSPLQGETITQFTDDAEHVCALTEEGDAFCWSQESGAAGKHGELGNGDSRTMVIPQAVVTSGELAGAALSHITTGSAHTCALTDVGAAYCWGDNRKGQLGGVPEDRVTTPVAVTTKGVLSGRTLVDMDAGFRHTCAVSAGGRVFCWGANDRGQLGNGTTTRSAVPVAVRADGVLDGVTIVSVTAGESHTCATDTVGAVYCWGRNDLGQLGNGVDGDSAVPVAVDTSGNLADVTVAQVAAGEWTTCALASDQAVYCWGYGGNGQMGNNTYTSTNRRPRAVDMSGALAGVTIVDLSLGARKVIAQGADGRTYGWGSGFNGELGQLGFKDRPFPIQLRTSPLLDDARVTAVGVHTYALWMATEAR